MDGLLARLRGAVRSRLLPWRHTALLGAIVTALGVRPLIGDTGRGPLVFSIAIMLLMIVALWTIEVDERADQRELLRAGKRRRRTVGWVLAAAAIAERIYVTIAPTAGVYTVGLITWFLFFAFVTACQLRSIVRQRDVTRETISMSVAVYLLLGLSWGIVYMLMFQIHRDSFSFASAPASTASLEYNEQHIFPVFIYFSLTTLATIGYGDILPVTLPARYAAVSEGIAGQFYLAILVARLVGIYMSQTLAAHVGEDDRAGPPTP